MADLLNYRPSNSAVYYTPDRRIAHGRVVAGFLLAAVLIILGSFFYGWLQPNVGSPILRVCMVIGAAFAVGGLGIIPVQMGRVREPVVASFIGGLLALLALYVMWVSWVHELLRLMGVHVPIYLLVKHPIVLWHLIEHINAVGAWSYEGNVSKGIALLLLWLIEAGCVLAGGVLIPLRALPEDNPVCRECGARCVRIPRLPRFADDRQREFIAAVENREFGALATHAAPAHGDAPELTLVLLCCPRCHTTNVLTVNRLAWVLGKNNRPQVTRTPLVNRLLITRDEAEELKRVCGEIAQQRSGLAVLPAEAEPGENPGVDDATGETELEQPRDVSGAKESPGYMPMLDSPPPNDIS